MTVAMLTKLTVAQLKAKAKELGLTGYSKLKKAELVNLLIENQGRTPEQAELEEAKPAKKAKEAPKKAAKKAEAAAKPAAKKAATDEAPLAAKAPKAETPRKAAKKADKDAPKVVSAAAEKRELVDRKGYHEQRLEELGKAIPESSPKYVPGTNFLQEELRSLNHGLPVLPGALSRDQLVLLPVNPHFVHLYWDFTLPTVEEIQRTGASAFELRLYDISQAGKGELVNTVQVDPWARAFYLEIPKSGHAYLAELGLNFGGSFQVLLSSNPIVTPVNGKSQVADDHFVTIAWERPLAEVPTRRLEHPRIQTAPTGALEPKFAGRRDPDPFFEEVFVEGPARVSGSEHQIGGSWQLKPGSWQK